MTYPTEKSPSISKPNKFFDLSFVGFDKMAQFIDSFVLLWMLNAFIDRMIGLWNDHSDYINNIFLSMNVAHAKSGSTIQCIPGLTHGLLGIMFCGAWQMFCLDFAVIQVVFLVTACPFFQEKSQLLSLQCYQNQSCHSWLRQKCPDTCNCIFFVLSITLSLCSRFISFRVTIITLFILKCQGFISVLQKFIICFSMQSFVQFTITSFWFKKFFIKITFYLLLEN